MTEFSKRPGSDLATMPLEELAVELKKMAKALLDKNDFIKGMVFNVIAIRFQEAVDELEKYEEVMRELNQWSKAYPLDVFPEPDFKAAEKVLQDNGMGISAISASNMRYVMKGVKKIIGPLLEEST